MTDLFPNLGFHISFPQNFKWKLPRQPVHLLPATKSTLIYDPSQSLNSSFQGYGQQRSRTDESIQLVTLWLCWHYVRQLFQKTRCDNISALPTGSPSSTFT